MESAAFLSWPFFEGEHRDLHRRATSAAGDVAGFLDKQPDESPEAVDRAVCQLVRALGDTGLLRYAVSRSPGAAPDVRSLCILRETLAAQNGLADFAFAMQGLGSGPIGLFGDAVQRDTYLPKVESGRWIAGFALSEAEAGSDVAAMSTRAHWRDGRWHLEGSKSWVSNAGIADFYVVFARTGDEGGSKGITAFIVESDIPGLEVRERPEIIAPHPLGTLAFSGCRLAPERVLGQPGQGFAIAMATLDVFRTTVGAAALGFARRSLAAAVHRAKSRRMFDATLGDLQMTKSALADMALDVDTSALLVYRAAWLKDTQRLRVSREASMAKLHATEAAQRVIDACVQIHGGSGVVRGSLPERLYREIRALRIYEGASEVQKLIIAGQLLKAAG